MRIAANKAYCRVCRTALLTRKSLIPMRTSAKSVPRKKRTAATPQKPCQKGPSTVVRFSISIKGGHGNISDDRDEIQEQDSTAVSNNEEISVSQIERESDTEAESLDDQEYGSKHAFRDILTAMFISNTD